MMLHLSLLTLGRRDAQWRRLDLHQLHQVVWKGARGAENRVLYRHDADEQHHSVLVQSEHAPDWSFLPEGTARTQTFDPAALTPGALLQFRLRANPVVRRREAFYVAQGKSPEQATRQRVLVGSHREYVAEKLGLTADTLPGREEQLVRWLERKAEGAGFALAIQEGPEGEQRPACITGPPQTYRVHRPEERPLTFIGVEFTGLLRVADPAALAETVRSGIGRGKAFGFGLLSLAPVR